MSNLAYIFPGQGSQATGMLSDVAALTSIVTDTFSEASAVLDYDLWELVQTDPENKLNQTEFTQPALLAASTALWRVACDRGIKQPGIVAGHSLGEYSALVAADVVDFSDAIGLVQKRGQFMQSAVPLGQGGMAAIMGLDDETVRLICRENSSESEVVQAANYNTPGQVVIAGHQAALESAMAALKTAGAKRAMPLAVSAPFHSELMRPAAERMSDELAQVAFSQPSFKVIQNVDASYSSDPDVIRSNLVSQMFSAVLWTATIEKFARDGIEIVVECGPGRVLSGMNRRITKSLRSLCINSCDSLQATVAELDS